MSGLYPPTSANIICLISDWNTSQGKGDRNYLFILPLRIGGIRYPTHSLLRFLIVSNSLDLILDYVLELWSAVVGTSLQLTVNGGSLF